MNILSFRSYKFTKNNNTQLLNLIEYQKNQAIKNQHKFIFFSKTTYKKLQFKAKYRNR